MARLSAELALTLRDGVSGPARKVGNSLDGLERKVRSQAGIAGGINAANAAAMARAGSVLAPAALGYAAKAAVTRYASVERAINRIGVTAGATAEETRAAFGIIDKAAFDYATSQDQVTEGLDSLVSAGRSLKDAMAFLPAVVATAQASGAEIKDIATTADAVGTGFDIAGNKMQDAFDILVTGGKLGKFELKDMAQYLPTLVPAFEALGYKGEAGLKKITAALQVVRAGTGSAGEAATAFQNVIQKMESEETAKRFKSFGIDLRKEMADARREGRDLLDVFIELSQKAVGGDLSKLPQLFADSQMQAGMRALLNGVPQLAGYMRDLGNAAGSTQKDLARILDDPQAKIDKMAASWDALVKNIGAGVSTVASPAMDAINATFEGATAYSAGVEKERAQGGGEDEARDEFTRRYEKAYGETWQGKYYKPLVEAFKRDMARYGRGETASPYEDIDRVLAGRTTQRFPTRADADAAEIARRERNGSNIDAETVLRGVPTPVERPDESMPPAPLTAAQQRVEYNRRRLAGEAAARRRLGEMSGREALAGIVGRIDAASPPSSAPPVAVPGIAAPIQAEGDRAALAAEAAGQRIQSAFDVTAKPIIDTSSIDVLLQKIVTARNGLAALNAQANDVAASAAAAAGRTSRVNYDGLQADTTHTGF